MRVLSEQRLVFVVILLFLSSLGSHGQTPGRAPIVDIIDGAAEQRKAYINEFKNLMSQETKTFQVFDKKGQVKKRTSVVSIFIVYQLSKDDRTIAEYRNVVSVDGKKIGDADKRAQDFFEEIAKVDSSKKELEKLDKEGSRFDDEISLNLFTLYQSVALADNMLPFFEFKLDGVEKMGDRDVFVVDYQQSKDSPYILTDPKKATADGKLTLVYEVDYGDNRNLNSRLRGKLWIDTLTFQVWKELRVLTVQPEGFSTPALFAENTFEYASSDFGVLTPRKISYTQFRIDKKEPVARKEAAVIFDYENFTKPDVEVKSADVKN